MFSMLKKFPVVLLALLLNCLTAYAQSLPIRLGQFLPLIGLLADIGTEYGDGMHAYFKAMNAKGGIHGRRVELASSRSFSHCRSLAIRRCRWKWAKRQRVSPLPRLFPASEKLVSALGRLQKYDVGNFVVAYGKDPLCSHFIEVTIVGSSGRRMREAMMTSCAAGFRLRSWQDEYRNLLLQGATTFGMHLPLMHYGDLRCYSGK